MGDDAFHGPEVRTRCLIKSHICYPQVKIGIEVEREEEHKREGC